VLLDSYSVQTVFSYVARASPVDPLLLRRKNPAPSSPHKQASLARAPSSRQERSSRRRCRTGHPLLKRLDNGAEARKWRSVMVMEEAVDGQTEETSDRYKS
jgi:hypothetical protein